MSFYEIVVRILIVLFLFGIIFGAFILPFLVSWKNIEKKEKDYEKLYNELLEKNIVIEQCFNILKNVKKEYPYEFFVETKKDETV